MYNRICEIWSVKFWPKNWDPPPPVGNGLDPVLHRKIVIEGLEELLHFFRILRMRKNLSATCNTDSTEVGDRAKGLNPQWLHSPLMTIQGPSFIQGLPLDSYPKGMGTNMFSSLMLKPKVFSQDSYRIADPTLQLNPPPIDPSFREVLRQGSSFPTSHSIQLSHLEIWEKLARAGIHITSHADMFLYGILSALKSSTPQSDLTEVHLEALAQSHMHLSVVLVRLASGPLLARRDAYLDKCALDASMKASEFSLRSLQRFLALRFQKWWNIIWRTWQGEVCREQRHLSLSLRRWKRPELSLKMPNKLLTLQRINSVRLFPNRILPFKLHSKVLIPTRLENLQARRRRIKNRGARFCKVCPDPLESSGLINTVCPNRTYPPVAGVSLPSGLANDTIDQWTVCDKKRVSYSISCQSQTGQSSSSVFVVTSSRSREDLTPLRDRIHAGKASLPGNAFACIPGRLAPTSNLPVPVHSTPGSVTEDGFEPGICPKFELIPSQMFCFLGARFDLEKGSEIANDCTEDVGISFSICPGSSFFIWTDGICGPSPTLWPGSQAFTTMACERPVVSGNPVLGLLYFAGSLVQTSNRARAAQGFSSCFGSAGSSTTRLLSVQGCASARLGRPFGRSLSFRPVVCSMEPRTHKCSGIPSSLVSSEDLLSGNFRLPNVAVDKQHNRGGLSEQRSVCVWGGGEAGQVSNLVVHGN